MSDEYKASPLVLDGNFEEILLTVDSLPFEKLESGLLGKKRIGVSTTPHISDRIYTYNNKENKDEYPNDNDWLVDDNGANYHWNKNLCVSFSEVRIRKVPRSLMVSLPNNIKSPVLFILGRSLISPPIMSQLLFKTCAGPDRIYRRIERDSLVLTGEKFTHSSIVGQNVNEDKSRMSRHIVIGQTKNPDSINGGDSEELDFVRLQPLIFHIQTLLGVGYRVLPCSYTWEFIAALSAFRQHLPAEFWGKTCPYSLLCGSTETLQMDEGWRTRVQNFVEMEM
ncbi:hypothetical protein OUZ56_004878 [Daphnia magna]|uniref:Uncharacterized protein n=1 Tax=Daphnia magna TaxID=35525 RepID=A0ABQ9YR51_9CRUS|nr:hypothetical protein OUZ56_004878 [Daphnia magna]